MGGGSDGTLDILLAPSLDQIQGELRTLDGDVMGLELLPPVIIIIIIVRIIIIGIIIIIIKRETGEGQHQSEGVVDNLRWKSNFEQISVRFLRK